MRFARKDLINKRRQVTKIHFSCLLLCKQNPNIVMQNEGFFDIGYFPKKKKLLGKLWAVADFFFSKFRDYRINSIRLLDTKNK